MSSNPTEALRSACPVICGLIDTHGELDLSLNPSDFESLVRAITFQQLSGRVASVIYGRFRSAAVPDSNDRRLQPADVLQFDIDTLRNFGLSRQKAAYIRDLAEKTHAGVVKFDRFPDMDNEEIIAELMVVKGIGVWTAQMYLMFSLGRPDVLPVLDLGIRTAMQREFNLENLPKPNEMEALAKAWRPHRSLACRYLWRSLDSV